MWELHTHFLTNADGDADGGQSILHIAPFHNVGTDQLPHFEQQTVHWMKNVNFKQTSQPILHASSSMYITHR